MEKRQVRCSCYLMITALIWGAAFVAQSKGGDAIGPYSFSCLRYFLAGLMMLPLRSLFNRWGITDCMPPTRKNQRNLWIGGILCGVFLCFVSIFQQLGLYMGTQSGKAGFLSSCYIVIVPILGLFLKKEVFLECLACRRGYAGRPLSALYQRLPLFADVRSFDPFRRTDECAAHFDS